VPAPPKPLSLTENEKTALRNVAAKVITPGKGVLASDDTADGLGPRLEALGHANSAESRRKYRQILYTTPNLAEHISAVILIDETFRQKADNGKRFVDLLAEAGCVVGVQADLGLEPLEPQSTEFHSKGLDGLDARLAEYKQGGVAFAKWRAALVVSEDGRLPSEAAVHRNVTELAAYAVASQRNGLVPFVEPDVVCVGAHSLAACKRATERALANTFAALTEAGVYLPGIILKPNMVTSGLSYAGAKATPDEVAAATVDAFRNTIPPAVPGAVFLSGGQTELDATLNLNAIAKQKAHKPWTLTFCYGRAIQGPVMKVWNGKPENVRAAQRTLQQRAKANGHAQRGTYQSEEQITHELSKMEI